MMIGRKRMTRLVTASGLVMAMVLSLPAQAQQTGVGYHYAIPAQPMRSALTAWSATSGIRVQSLPQIAEGVTASTVDGHMTPVAALAALLQGTGYSFRFTRIDAIVIEAIPTGGLNGTIGTVRVQGTTDIATQGVNGSTDPTATEGSDSYAADQTTIATKLPLAIKDTPQSVSVVTQQQLRDRNVTDFDRALMEAPGISTVYGSSTGQNQTRNNLQPTFFSRGFQIDRLQIDGGAPLSIASYAPGALVPQINMASYDHVEILRGADGLFDGSGNPGGVVNLARKRPLDHQQFRVEQLIESYNGFNTTIDGSSPIGFGGDLRARVVLNRQSNDYFYDTAKNKQYLIYAILEAQLTSSTLISFGVNYQSQQAVPFYNGLIGGIADGKVVDLKLSRSTCFCFSSNTQDYYTREFFAKAEQSFGPDWKITVQGSATHQSSYQSFLGVIGTYGSADPDGTPRLSDGFSKSASTQFTVDATVNGAFRLFGQRQLIVFGGNLSSFDGGGAESYQSQYQFVSSAPLVDIFNFNQADYAAPDHNTLPTGYTPLNRTQNIGVYGKAVLSVWKPLHFTIGMRYNRFSVKDHVYAVCRNADFGCSDFNTGDVVSDGSVYNDSRTNSTQSSFFPAGYLALTLDLSKTLSAYVSKTAIYIDNSLAADVNDKPLAPTTGNNFEGGLKYASSDHRLTAAIAGFYLRQRGYPLPVFVFPLPAGVDPLTFKFPSGRVCCSVNDPDSLRKSYGVDVEIAGEVHPGLQVSASYTYNKTRNISGPLQPTQPLDSQVPEHLYRVWVKYSFQPGSMLKDGYVGLGLQGQSEGFVQSEVCTASSEFGCNADGFSIFTIKQPPRVIASLQAGWDFSRKLSVALTVNNLLDKRYYASVGLIDGGNWYGAPRNFSIALRGSF